MDFTHDDRNAAAGALSSVPLASPAKSTLLFIGPEGVFPEDQVKSRNHSLKCVDNYVQARYLLEKAVTRQEDLPSAIICEVSLSRAGDYSLVEVIRKHEELRKIPFIIISPDGQSVDTQQALRMGVDDCYRMPFAWSEVFDRIEFLRAFKKELTEGNPASESRFDGRIPVAKRVFDIVVAGSLLLLLSPFLLLIALAIKLESKGPIFYISKRAGSGYDVFDFYKFRSMRQDADKELQNLMHLNQYEGEEAEEEAATFIKIENDPRITRLGKFIRNTSIDELPQLLNVLKGDMSIVGNRPLPLYEAEMLTNDGSAGRFLAPAGITGLWQVTKRGGNDMSISERIALDIEYANKYSVVYDFNLIFKTIPALLQQSSV